LYNANITNNCVDVVAKFAQEKVAPLVKEMDEKEELDRSIIDGLFKHGVSNLSLIRTFTSSSGVGSCSKVGGIFKLSGHICMEKN